MVHFHRIHQAKQDGTCVVDVEGSFRYTKYKSLTDAGEKVAEPGPPYPPLTGWKLLPEDTYKHVGSCIPLVTSGEPKNASANVCCVYYVNALCTCMLGIHLPSWACRGRK